MMSVTLVFFFQHMGLALATSLAAFVNAGLLYRGLRKSGVLKPAKDWFGFILKVVVANVIAGLVYYYDYSLAQWLEWSAFDRATHLLLEITLVFSIYVITLLLVGMRPRHLNFKQ